MTERLEEGLAGSLRAELRSAIPWWLPLLVGILSVAMGVVIWIWPGLSLITFAVLVGVWLLALGVSRVIGAFMPRADRTTGQHVLSGLIGVLYIIAGVICLRHLVVSLALVAVLVAVQWLLTGVADISMGMQAQGSHRVWMVIGGVLSLLLGIVFLVLPALTLTFFIIFTAISAIVVGVVQIGVAFRLRQLERG